MKKRKLSKAEVQREKKKSNEEEWNEYYAQLIEYGMEKDTYQVPPEFTVMTDDGRELQLGAWLQVQGSRLTEYAKSYPQWYSDIMDIVETGKLWFDPDKSLTAAAKAKLQSKKPSEDSVATRLGAQGSAAAKTTTVRDRAAALSDSDYESEESLVQPIHSVFATSGSLAKATSLSKLQVVPPPKPSAPSANKGGALKKKGVAVSSTSRDSVGTAKTTVSSKSTTKGQKQQVVDLSHSDSEAVMDSDSESDVSEELSDNDYHSDGDYPAPTSTRATSIAKSTTSQTAKSTPSRGPSPYSSASAKERILSSAAAASPAKQRGRPRKDDRDKEKFREKDQGKNKSSLQRPTSTSSFSARTPPSAAPSVVTPAAAAGKDSTGSRDKLKKPLPTVPSLPASMTLHKTPEISVPMAATPLPAPKGILREEQSTSFELNGVYPPRRTITRPRPVPPVVVVESVHTPDPAPVVEESSDPSQMPPVHSPAVEVTRSEPPLTSSVSSYKPVSVAAIRALTSAMTAARQNSTTATAAGTMTDTLRSATAEPKMIVSTPSASTTPEYITLPPKISHSASAPAAATAATTAVGGRKPGSNGSPRPTFPAPQLLYSDVKAGVQQRRSIRESKQQSAPVLDTPPGSQDQTQNVAYFTAEMQHQQGEGRFACESKDSPAHAATPASPTSSAMPPLLQEGSPEWMVVAAPKGSDHSNGDDDISFEMMEEDDVVVVGGRRGSPRGKVVLDAESQPCSQVEPQVLMLEDVGGPTHSAFVAELLGSAHSSSSSHFSTGTAATDSDSDGDGDGGSDTEKQGMHVQTSSERDGRATSVKRPAVDGGSEHNHAVEVGDDAGYSNSAAVQTTFSAVSEAANSATVSKSIDAATDQTAGGTTSDNLVQQQQQATECTTSEAVEMEMEVEQEEEEAEAGKSASSSPNSTSGSDPDSDTHPPQPDVSAGGGGVSGNGAADYTTSVIDVPASLEEIIGPDSSSSDEDSGNGDASDDGSVKMIGTSYSNSNGNSNSRYFSAPVTTGSNKKEEKEFVAFAYTRTSMGRHCAMLGIGMVCSYEAEKLFLMVMRPTNPARPATTEYTMDLEETVIVGVNVVLARSLAFENGKNFTAYAQTIS